MTIAHISDTPGVVSLPFMITTTALTSVCRPAVAAGLAAVLAAGCAQATQTARTTPSAPAEGSAPATAAAATAAGQAAPAAKTPMAKSADGTMIAWEKTGSGPALLLVHGGGQNRKSWAERGYVERLAKKFTVITMDVRGQGESGRPDTPEGYALDHMLEDITAVADAAGAARFHLWGFGHGATVARYLAARSDRVISAVLVGADMGAR